MQLQDEPVLSLWWQLLIEVVLLTVGCVLFSIVYFVGLFLVRRHKRRTTDEVLDHVRHELLCTISTAVTMVMVAGLMFYVIQFVPVQTFLPAWRFGVLSFFLGAVVVAVIEIVGLLKKHPIAVQIVLADPFIWVVRPIYATAGRIWRLFQV